MTTKIQIHRVQGCSRPPSDENERFRFPFYSPDESRVLRACAVCYRPGIVPTTGFASGGDFLLNRADSGANAATTEGNHGRLSYPAASKSPGIRTSDVRERDKALRFPTGKVNQKHRKGIPRLLYTESVMRAPELGALRPLTITRVLVKQ